MKFHELEGLERLMLERNEMVRAETFRGNTHYIGLRFYFYGCLRFLLFLSCFWLLILTVYIAA